MAQTDSTSPGTIRSATAVVLARVVIPLWLGIGAVLKVVDGSPSNLPAAFVKWIGGLGVDLRFLLEFSITAELVVVGVMVLIPGLARVVGIAVLAAFMPVLIGDLALGASSCGCFGAVEVSPWVTLLTDGIFLLGLIVLGRGVPALKTTATLPTWRVVAAGTWSILSVAIAFGLTTTSPPVVSEGAVSGPVSAVSGLVSAGPVQGYYLPDYTTWLGRPFHDLELAAWIRGLPDDLDVGQQYLLFYRKDCEHCHELMEVFFSDSLTLPTTAVAVPERGGYPTDGIQPFVCRECSMAELPAGVDWFLQTPVLVRIGNGVVECAAEVTADNPLCLVW